MKTFLKLTLATALTCALPAWATCTPEEATAKREQLAQEVTKLTEQNPTKAKEMNDELQAMDLETASKDVPDKCQLIDKRLQELKQAEKKAG
ncbi:hypothetical protein [Pseudomonas sp. Pdm06]|uniref:hypothetical protein n=1 Tax=Pseudomonas sp. Pdm06 TaxID=1790044 RepID=UPI001785B017|nr:hypothetical protein [Pseudomonas sp. Pdm06]MBD9466642.1 hypothetical protein [Pseudomonas sp. Pdm06]